MSNQKVKCTRCRHKHLFSDRNNSRPDKMGYQHSECPRCDGRIYTAAEEDKNSAEERE